MGDGRKICVLEDHEDVRADIVGRLKGRGFDIVAEAGTLAEAEAFIGVAPDIVLADLQLPDGLAFDLIETLHAAQIRTLILSSLDDASSLLRGLRAGAVGYVLKTSPGFELEEAVAMAERGEAPISPSIARYILSDQYRGDQVAQPDQPSLSKREREILERIAAGRSRKEIARDLDLSPYTVAEYSANILRKYGVPSSAAAVAEAIRRGEID